MENSKIFKKRISYPNDGTELGRNCEGCPRDGKNWFVFPKMYYHVDTDPYGKDNEKIWIVGQSPGDQEMKKREVFVGASGRLLDRVILPEMREMEPGLIVEFRNVISCGEITRRGKVIHLPIKERCTEDVAKASKICGDHLVQQFIHSAPTRILLMGRWAQKWASSNAITRIAMGVGDTIDGWRYTETLDVYHPSYVLRLGGELDEIGRVWKRQVRDFIRNR